jgi:tRNA(adenine34) deaminase
MENIEINDDDYFMARAYNEALAARDIDDVPIGCVIVCGGEIIGRGFNRRMAGRNTLLHAEIIAVNEACARLGDWRLEGCAAYVTVEPCPMCAGAFLQARLTRLVFGAANPKAGACGSVINLAEMDGFNHKIEVLGGVWGEECAELMKKFFKARRA